MRFSRHYLRRFGTLLILISISLTMICLFFYSTLSNSSQIEFNYKNLSASSIGKLSTTFIVRQIVIPDIFDLSLWRSILLGGHGNQTKCLVPRQYRSIANAYCRIYNRENCATLPCTLLYLSKEYTANVECLRGGKAAINVKPNWICRKSPALELFSNPKRKPSIHAEAYTPLSSELYGQALAPFRDLQTSKWGLTLEGESIGYYPSVANASGILRLFDITLGYDRRLFDLITDAYLTDYVDRIINNNKRLTIKQVLKDKVNDLAPILWINSNCDALSNRTGYMLELMRYIRVDALGKCGNSNWNQTLSLSNQTLLAKEKTVLAKKYLFTVAIENSLEYDYVTEKLWQPLAAGSVPLYLGAPNIDDWLPCSNYSCIINLRQFSSVRDAASLIKQLVQNKKLYLKYHQWRKEKTVRSSFIKIVDYFNEANKHTVECLLCDMVYRNDHGTIRQKLLAATNLFNETFPSLI